MLWQKPLSEISIATRSTDANNPASSTTPFVARVLRSPLRKAFQTMAHTSRSTIQPDRIIQVLLLCTCLGDQRQIRAPRDYSSLRHRQPPYETLAALVAAHGSTRTSQPCTVPGALLRALLPAWSPHTHPVCDQNVRWQPTQAIGLAPQPSSVQSGRHAHIGPLMRYL
jgi:hypothetical protein